MRRARTYGVLAGVIALTGCSLFPVSDRKATPVQSLSAAQSSCGVMARSFANRPLLIQNEDGGFNVGLLAEFPEERQVQAYYRRCVQARAGRPPSAPLDKWL